MLRLVENVSFTLDRGKTLAVVGESGCGKTTLAHTLLRLFPENARYSLLGKIIFEKGNLLEASLQGMQRIRGKDIGIIFQDPSSALNPVFSIGAQLCEMFEVHEELLFEEAKKKTIELLKRVDLPHADSCFDMYPHQISGGMKQRVLIAMAVSLKPKLLIADEPTTALDTTIQREILFLLKSLQEEYDMALLLITHDIAIVKEMADDVAVMYGGEFVENASCNELFSTPAHPYTQALLAARPQKKCRKQSLPLIQGAAPSPSHRQTGCPFHPRCPFVMPICREGEVPLFEKEEHPLHICKCWLCNQWRKRT